MAPVHKISHVSFVLFAMRRWNVLKQTVCRNEYDIKVVFWNSRKLTASVKWGADGSALGKWEIQSQDSIQQMSECISSSWPDRFALPPLHTRPKAGTEQAKGSKLQAILLLSTEKII